MYVYTLVNTLGCTKLFIVPGRASETELLPEKSEYLFTFLENASFLMLVWFSECVSVMHTHTRGILWIVNICFKLVIRFRSAFCMVYTFICTFFSINYSTIQYNIYFLFGVYFSLHQRNTVWKYILTYSKETNQETRNATRCNNRDDLHLSVTLKIWIFSEAYI